MTYRIQGIVDDYDLDGEGTCLTTALIAYAKDCRETAERYQKMAKNMLTEAARADAAAAAAELASPERRDGGGGE